MVGMDVMVWVCAEALWRMSESFLLEEM